MKKLYRSRRLRVLGGVAGGLSEYFDVDVTLVRLAIALLTVITPNIILAYLLAWIIIPEAPRAEPSPGQPGTRAQDAKSKGQGEACTQPEPDRPAGSSADDAQAKTAGAPLPPTAREILAAAGLDQTPEGEGDGAREPAAEPSAGLPDEQGESEKPADCAVKEPGAEPAEEPTKHASAENASQLQGKPAAQAKPSPQTTEVDRNKQFFGYLLIVIGALYLLKRYMPTYWLRMPVRFIRTWWPLVIILIGVAIVLSVFRRDR